MIDLKLARLAHDPSHRDSLVDVIGYAASCRRSAHERHAVRAQGLWRRAPQPDQVKRDGWREQGLFAVSLDDERLTWPERELVRQLGERLYGERATKEN